MSYIDNLARPAYGKMPEEPFSWSEFTRSRLIWRYGPERAQAIMDGKDPATNADIAAWRNLGGVAA